MKFNTKNSDSLRLSSVREPQFEPLSSGTVSYPECSEIFTLHAAARCYSSSSACGFFSPEAVPTTTGFDVFSNEVVLIRADSITTWGGIPTSWGEPPTTWGEGPLPWGETPATWGEVPSAWEEVPTTWGGPHSSWEEVPTSWGDTPSSREDVPDTWEDTATIWRETSAALADALYL
jgi:hypothetical protein